MPQKKLGPKKNTLLKNKNIYKLHPPKKNLADPSKNKNQKMVLVLLSTLVEIFSVSRTRDFFYSFPQHLFEAFILGTEPYNTEKTIDFFPIGMCCKRGFFVFLKSQVGLDCVQKFFTS